MGDEVECFASGIFPLAIDLYEMDMLALYEQEVYKAILFGIDLPVIDRVIVYV